TGTTVPLPALALGLVKYSTLTASFWYFWSKFTVRIPALLTVASRISGPKAASLSPAKRIKYNALGRFSCQNLATREYGGSNPSPQLPISVVNDNSPSSP